MIRSKCELQRFFVFNSTLNGKEGQEHEKILYFYPSDTNSEVKKNTVGLCEAVVKFMTTFSVDDCESLHTQKTKQIFYQPETNYWMVMSVKVPYVEKTSSDGKIYFEYHGEEVQTKVLQSVLSSAHKMFRLFTGAFSQMPVEVLRTKLENFFHAYLSQIDLSNCDVLDIFQGVQYLPLDRLSFFRVQCFVNLVEAKFPFIKHTIFLYNDQLIWSGISPSDVQIVYKYLVGTLLPEHIAKELQGTPHVAAQHYGCFVSPPNGFRESSDLARIIKVHLNWDTKHEVYYLLVYRALAATMCFFIDHEQKLSLNLVRGLDTFVGPQLSAIASEIAEQCDKVTSPVNSSNNDLTGPKYIYFNQINFAYKSTVHLDNRHTGNISVSPEVLKLVADITGDRKCLERYGEIIMKTMSDFWVIGKISNMREFYVIIQHKNANLKEISDEVKKLCESKLKSIFFYPV